MRSAEEFAREMFCAPANVRNLAAIIQQAMNEAAADMRERAVEAAMRRSRLQPGLYGGGAIDASNDIRALPIEEPQA